jgi:hypothetical protein
MVKGISRQVIVVHDPQCKLFEQAIFILSEGAVGKEGVTDQALLQEAKRLFGSSGKKKRRFYGPVWACGGAVVTALVWLVTALL